MRLIRTRSHLGLVLVGIGVSASCIVAGDDAADGGDEAGDCGPATAFVEFVIDGDTVELTDGRRVRYLLVDTPETTTDDCWADVAMQHNINLVEGKQVSLVYDEECTDQYGRLLAYVTVDGLEVNTDLVRNGHACVLHIPPNGNDRVTEFSNLEFEAQSSDPPRGMWNPVACADVACDD